MPPTRADRASSTAIAAALLGLALGGGCAHAPTQAQINAGMARVHDALAACRQGAPPEQPVQLDLIVVEKGTVGSAKVIGAIAHTPTGDCLEAAARNARFTRFYGAPVRFIWPVDLR